MILNPTVTYVGALDQVHGLGTRLEDMRQIVHELRHVRHLQFVAQPDREVEAVAVHELVRARVPALGQFLVADELVELGAAHVRVAHVEGLPVDVHEALLLTLVLGEN